MIITKRQLRAIIKEERSRLLLEDSISRVEEQLFNALDEYVQVMDEELGYDVPLHALRRQVDDLVGSAFAQFEADQKAEDDLRSWKSPSVN